MVNVCQCGTMTLKINCSSLSASLRETPGLKLLKTECRVSKMLNQVSQARDKGVYI